MNISELISSMQNQAPELIWGLQAIFVYGMLLLMLRFFGKTGVILYLCLAVVVANIQVLKAVSFSALADPVALGTLLFSTTFLATDILSEYYSPQDARRAVWMSFTALFFTTTTLLLTIAMQPIDPEAYQGSYAWAWQNHQHLQAIFSPTPALFISGMISFLISQWLDIILFCKIRQATSGRYLWLRNNLSTLISAFIDSCLFSILAWIVLSEDPLPWSVVIFSYILGTFGIRILLSLADTPILYWARWCLPPHDRPAPSPSHKE